VWAEIGSTPFGKRFRKSDFRMDDFINELYASWQFGDNENLMN
jgi:hypothetical protein